MRVSNGGVLWIGRSAETGRFIPKAEATRRKKTAIVQKLKVSRLKNGRFAKRGVN